MELAIFVGSSIMDDGGLSRDVPSSGFISVVIMGYINALNSSRFTNVVIMGVYQDM